MFYDQSLFGNPADGNGIGFAVGGVDYNIYYQLFFGSQPDYFNLPLTSSSNSNITTVPEPSTWALTLLGFAGLGYAGFLRAGKSRVALG